LFGNISSSEHNFPQFVLDKLHRVVQIIAVASWLRIQKEGGGVKMAVTGYCVKCKAKQEMLTPEKITMKNGRPATKGTCPKCGTKMFKIGA
jgi:hypothetical protein